MNHRYPAIEAVILIDLYAIEVPLRQSEVLSQMMLVVRLVSVFAVGRITCLSNHRFNFTALHWKSPHTRTIDIQHRGSRSP
jgi:hypothetical protein